MRVISSRQAKVMGGLGIFAGVMSVLAVYAVGTDRLVLVGASLVVLLWAVYAAYFGIFSRWLAFDQAYMVVRKGKAHERYLLAEVVKVRTVPYSSYLGIVWITHATGRTFWTVVLDEDLTWIMSQVPPEAITPYWRRKLR